MVRLVGVYDGDTWEEDVGNTGSGHIIPLERQKGLHRVKKPVNIVCPNVVDDEQYATGFNPVYPEELPVEMATAWKSSRRMPPRAMLGVVVV